MTPRPLWHCPFQNGPRRRRPRDGEREAARPPRRVRQARRRQELEAVGSETIPVCLVDDSTSSESLATESPHEDAGTGASTRPITLYNTVSRTDSTDRQVLQREMAPDAFMALASQMGRPYAQARADGRFGSSSSSGAWARGTRHTLVLEYPRAVGATPGTDLTLDQLAEVEAADMAPSFSEHRSWPAGSPPSLQQQQSAFYGSRATSGTDRPRPKKRPRMDGTRLDSPALEPRQIDIPPLVTVSESQAIDAITTEVPPTWDLDLEDTPAVSVDAEVLNAPAVPAVAESAPRTPPFAEVSVIFRVALLETYEARLAEGEAMIEAGTPPQAFAWTPMLQIVRGRVQECERERRSVMIIGGDFNTSCTTAKPHVGTGLLPPPPNWALDQEDFQALLVGLGLCAINTFADSGSPHTFAWGSQRSHIDFLLIRCDMADRFSRMARPLHEYPVGAWRGGPKHYPVFARIPVHWCPWHRTGTPQRTLQIHRHAIADALAGQADERVSSFRQELQSCLPQVGQELQGLHDAVYAIAVKHFPRKPPVQGPRPWQDGTLQQYAAHMWGHLRLLRRWAQRPGAAYCKQALFRCWYHSMKYLRMHRGAQQQGKTLRRARRQHLLTEAEQAISSGQSRLFYQLIDKLAPKGRFRKFQMNKGGQILSPTEELEVMRTHFLQVFNHGNSAQKAGAPGTVPGAAWRLCSDMISPHLTRFDLETYIRNSPQFAYIGTTPKGCTSPHLCLAEPTATDGDAGPAPGSIHAPPPSPPVDHNQVDADRLDAQAPMPEPEATSASHITEEILDTRKALKLHMARSHKIKIEPQAFDRATHSVDGDASTPAAPDVSSPSALGRPVADDSRGQSMICEAPAAVPRVPDHAGTITSECSLLVQVRSVLQQNGVSALLRHSLQAQLKSHCGLCGQWMASPTALRNHYRSIHSTLFQSAAAQAERLMPPYFFLLAMAGAQKTQATEDVLSQLQESFGAVIGKRGAQAPAQSSTDGRVNKVGRGMFQLGGRGKGFQGRGRPPQNRPRGPWQGGFEDQDQDQDGELLQMVARAVIMQGDSINVLRRATGWVFWVRSGDHSILPMLAELATKWHDAAQAETISPTRVSLRVALFWGIIAHLKDKHAQMNQENKAYALKSGWMSEAGCWNYQRWNPTHQSLEIDPERQALTQTQAQESLETLLKLINGDTITRFTARRELHADMQGTVAFQADVGLRAKGSEELYQQLERLRGLALFQIIGTSFRQEGYGRPPLIRAIQKLLR
ncbi:Pol [Symbiodinium sp. CCMP2592]|nr:Pol [Symbiodinium sp. CCMP2592]